MGLKYEGNDIKDKLTLVAEARHTRRGGQVVCVCQARTVFGGETGSLPSLLLVPSKTKLTDS